MIKWPGLAVLAVIDIALLMVPALSKAGEAGASTAGSKVICASYEITPLPVRSSTVIGMITSPGVAVMSGSDTAAHALVGVAVAVAVFVAVAVGVNVSVAVAVGVSVGVSVAVGVNVSVAVAVGVSVGVSVAVGVNVSVAVAVGV